MGTSGSKASDDPSEEVGYRVLGVLPESPAAKGGLVSFFDFIIGCNGTPFQQLEMSFVDLIQAHEEKSLFLDVYNWKSKTYRQIELIPSRKWPGEGMLGVTIRFDTYHDADQHLCHVIEVEENSPADLAGLQANNDYLLGTTEKAFYDVDVLREELESHVDRPLEIYVYNSEADDVRTCVVLPSYEWGVGGVRSGLLGANVAVGYLHVLPSHCCETLGKTREQGSAQGNDIGELAARVGTETSGSILRTETAAS